MGTTAVSGRTLCPTLKGWKWVYLVLDRKRLEPREFPWQQHYGFFCFVHFWCQVWRTLLRYSRDILYSVFYHFSCTTKWRHHFPNLHNTKTSTSLKQKKVFQKGNCHSFVFWKAFQIHSNYFSRHIHFKLFLIHVMIFISFIFKFVHLLFKYCCWKALFQGAQ